MYLPIKALASSYINCLSQLCVSTGCVLYHIGPLAETVDDFWRMIWEFKLPTIVMLTHLVEMSKVYTCTKDSH